MKTTLKAGLTVAMLAAAMWLSGCVAVVAGAAGAGAVAYVRGQLEAPLDSGYDQAVTATDQAIQQLQFFKISERKDALDAYFTVRTAGDRKIDIRVVKIADGASKVLIRVGFFGDEDLSMTVLSKIKENLPK